MSGVQIREESLEGSWSALHVAGEIDLANVDELKAALDQVFGSDGLDLVVDLSDLSFMDSTGLKTLVMAQREFEDAGRSFVLAIDGGPISRLIDLAGLDTSMRIVSDYRDVLSSS